MKNSWIFSIVCGVIFLLVVSIPAMSAPSNGSFSLGLNDWTSTGGVQIVSSGIPVGDSAAAELYDPQPGQADSVSVLSQTFWVDPGSSTLSFWVKTPNPIASETDHFFVSLYDSGNTPMFNTYNDPSLGIDYLFHWDSDTGWQNGESVLAEEGGPEINEAIDPDFLLYQFLVPVADVAGSDVTLTFTLRNHLDYEFGIEPPLLLDPQINTSILVDDVLLISNSPTAVVPAPTAIVLAVSGIMTIVTMRKRLF
jgi:hypothetical protein